MPDEKSKDIEVKNKVASSVGIFSKYASGQAREGQSISTAVADDKPKRKRKVIRLDQIVSFSPIQPGQREFNIKAFPEDLELADSIKETGQNEPVLVSFLGMDGDKGKYELVNGHRRFGAVKFNAGDNWASATLEAEILNSDEDKILVALHANRGMMGLTPSQRGELYSKLQDSGNLSLGQILERYHLAEKEEYIQRLIYAWKSPDPVRIMFSRGFPVNRTLDLRGAWNKLPEKWKSAHSETFSRLSFAGATLFIERTRSGSSPDDAFAAAQEVSPAEEIPLADSSLSQIGRGAAAISKRPVKSETSGKGKSTNKDDQLLLEPLFYSLGLPSSKINELKRAGGSDSIDEKILAGLAVRRGLDTQQSLTGARALTHSRPLRHIAHRLVQDISKVLTKSAGVPEYAFLKYILSFSDARPSPQPVDRKAAGKRGSSDTSQKPKKKKVK